MAKRQVYEITCDRCGKVETQQIEEHYKVRGCEINDPGVDQVKEVELRIPAVFKEPLVFEDLCKRCRQAVANYVQKIYRNDETAKSDA